ncbi:MAG: hypothetical protein JWR15_3365 [Prosthecobacter sp.]|nr:hypothetical protein [Prosthecobacter sp.]
MTRPPEYQHPGEDSLMVQEKYELVAKRLREQAEARSAEAVIAGDLKIHLEIDDNQQTYRERNKEGQDLEVPWRAAAGMAPSFPGWPPRASCARHWALSRWQRPPCTRPNAIGDIWGCVSLPIPPTTASFMKKTMTP